MTNCIRGLQRVITSPLTFCCQPFLLVFLSLPASSKNVVGPLQTCAWMNTSISCCQPSAFLLLAPHQLALPRVVLGLLAPSFFIASPTKHGQNIHYLGLSDPSFFIASPTKLKQNQVISTFTYNYRLFCCSSPCPR